MGKVPILGPYLVTHRHRLDLLPGEPAQLLQNSSEHLRFLGGKLGNCLEQGLFHRAQGTSSSKGDPWEHMLGMTAITSQLKKHFHTQLLGSFTATE